MSILNDDQIPVGLGMALAQDLDAMKAFSGLNESAKQQVIERSRQVSSKDEMKGIVSDLHESAR